MPVTFRYHIRLNDPWRLASRSNVCLVLAPTIRPSLPRAVHLDRIERRAESGWARFDKAENLAELERALTTRLNERAVDSVHSQAVREVCRRSVGEFVKNWLMREDYWRTDRFSVITVVFPDEVNVGSDRDLVELNRPPTMQLQ